MNRLVTSWLTTVNTPCHGLRSVPGLNAPSSQQHCLLISPCPFKACAALVHRPSTKQQSVFELMIQLLMISCLSAKDHSMCKCFSQQCRPPYHQLASGLNHSRLLSGHLALGIQAHSMTAVSFSNGGAVGSASMNEGFLLHAAVEDGSNCTSAVVGAVHRG